MIERAELHEHADGVHLWLHDDSQKWQDVVIVEDTEERESGSKNYHQDLGLSVSIYRYTYHEYVFVVLQR